MSDERLSHSPEQTLAIGAELGAALAAGGTLFLCGPLGAGKTLLAKAVFSALGADPDRVTSPTFVLVNQYRSATRPALPLYHVDLYRIEAGADIEGLGLEEMLDSGGVMLIEWAERLADGWCEPDLRVHIEDLGGDTRRIRIERTGNPGAS